MFVLDANISKAALDNGMVTMLSREQTACNLENCLPIYVCRAIWGNSISISRPQMRLVFKAVPLIPYRSACCLAGNLLPAIAAAAPASFCATTRAFLHVQTDHITCPLAQTPIPLLVTEHRCISTSNLPFSFLLAWKF